MTRHNPLDITEGLNRKGHDRQAAHDKTLEIKDVEKDTICEGRKGHYSTLC
jgi:hypothetical protein